MPKPPIHVTFVPSRLAFVSQLTLSLLIAAALGYWLAWWAGIGAASTLGLLAYLEAQRVPQALRLVRDGHEGQWEALKDGHDWRSVSLKAFRLGPWLTGLDIAGKRYWIWPDSASQSTLRHLRRALVHASSSGRTQSPLP